MRHYTRNHGDLLQDAHRETTGQRKNSAKAGYVGLVWTALGLVMVTSNVRAEQVRADNYKKNDVQTDVLISPIDALFGARIYILDDDGMIMDFDTDRLEMEDMSWGIDDDGNIFFLTDPTGKAMIPQLVVPHQIVALQAGSDEPVYALPHFLQHGDEVIISPLTDFLTKTITEKGLTDLEAGEFISTYLALDAVSSDFESLYNAIREEIITRIEDTRLLAEQHDEQIVTMQHQYAYGDDDNDIALPPAEALLAVSAAKDNADPNNRGHIRQQAEEQPGEDGMQHLNDLYASSQDQVGAAKTSPAEEPLPEANYAEEVVVAAPQAEETRVDDGIVLDPGLLADANVSIDDDSVSVTPEIL